MSTTRPYSGRTVPSMMPGFSWNWRRTSYTTAPAARDTALTASPENMNTTAAPMATPTSTFGLNTCVVNDWKLPPSEENSSSTFMFFAASATAPPIALMYEPNSAVAASTAVAIAMPLVIAFVVLPTASSSVSVRAPSSSMSPDISAMPCALSLIGPNVSIATMTPTVVNSPVPASATANSESVIEPPPSRKAPKTLAPMRIAEYTA